MLGSFNGNPTEENVVQLTERQREIKDRLDQGMGAREIAEDLGVTRNAVYQQIQRLRGYGELEADFTPTGQPLRETGATKQLNLMLVPTSALISELRRRRDELNMISFPTGEN